MPKKIEKTTQEGVEYKNSEVYERLRDELFQYRVEIQSYKRSMKILWTCVSVVIAVLGFFGYNHIESLLNKVEANANDRLVKTDSLLAKVDTRFLDSLISVVEEKTGSYEAAISALENGTRVNNELYKKLIASLPYNKRTKNQYKAYSVHNAINLFDIVYYDELYPSGNKGECYVIMGDEYIKEKDDALLVMVEPTNRHLAVFYQIFEIQSVYNKLYYKFDKTDGAIEYTLNVILLRKKGTNTEGYQLSKPITLK